MRSKSLLESQSQDDVPTEQLNLMRTRTYFCVTYQSKYSFPFVFMLIWFMYNGLTKSLNRVFEFSIALNSLFHRKHFTGC